MVLVQFATLSNECRDDWLFLSYFHTLRKLTDPAVLRIRIRDPVPFLPRIRDPEQVFPDPGSQTYVFESLMIIFWVKSSIILCKLAQICFLPKFNYKIVFNFVIFVLQKKIWQQIFFHPSLLLLFLDPGSEIRDSGWIKIRTRDSG